jgi:orotidine-5'-phosphate decarboxylase
MRGVAGMPRRERVIVALDEQTLDEARAIVGSLDGCIDFFKVGIGIYTICGPELVKLLGIMHKRVFLDLKFHDIPNSVSLAVKTALDRNVEMLNLHISGGVEMMKAAVRTAGRDSKPSSSRFPIVLGVTLLTSLNENDLSVMFKDRQPNVIEFVLTMAALAKEAGLDGVVASGHEIEPVKKLCGDDFLVVTPGIRPPWARRDEHKRALGPREAFERGADFIVIGRPITHATDPREAALRVIDEVDSSSSRT